VEELQQAVTDASAVLTAAQTDAVDAAAVFTAAEQSMAMAQSALDNAAEGDDLAILQQTVTDASAALADAAASTDAANQVVFLFLLKI
jgi:hypothetical protein